MPSPAPSAVPDPLVAVKRDSILLLGEWHFAVDPDGSGEANGWSDPNYDASDWRAVEVPHTWGVMSDHADYEGLAWYRRSFRVPETADGAHLRLRFEAVFYLARVWLNGEYLGSHEGGYTPFEFDVTGIARIGEENTVVVQVDNMRGMDRIPATLRQGWSFDWWNYGGIVRDVSLEVTSRAYIAHQRIVAVPHLKGWDQADSAQVTTTITLRNTTFQTINGTLITDIHDPSGNSALITPQEISVTLPPTQSIEVEISAEVISPALWHFDHPNLYRWSAVLATSDGTILDQSEERFGVRLIELKDAQFYLNGEPVRMVGLTRHADSPEHGLAETVKMMAADYDDLKRLNMVFSRPVHYPQHEYILDYCDRNGILLIPEIPAWQLTAAQMSDPQMQALAKQQITEMVMANANHPSVWAWSVGNEIESTTSQGAEYVQMMIEHTKALDPTRPVGFASNHLYMRPQQDATRYADFVLMNQYFGTWGGSKTSLDTALDWIHQTWPDKVVIISEYGFEPRWHTITEVSLDGLDPNKYYFISEDLAPESPEADAVRQQVIREQMAIYRSRAFVAGAIFWTYQDYRTPTDFILGVVDAERNPRGSWQVLREEYSPVVVDSVEITGETAAITLHARGPIEVEMPAYTLRGYTLHWEITSLDGIQTFGQGVVDLPVLAPAEAWTGEITWQAQNDEVVLRISMMRPTGFSVLDQIFEVKP